MTLSDYVLLVIQKEEISYQDIVRRARRKGFKITHGYISKLISGAAQNISVEKVRALAAGLNRPDVEVFAAAAGGNLKDQITDARAALIFAKYSQLSDVQKNDIASLLRSLDREIEESLSKRA